MTDMKQAFHAAILADAVYVDFDGAPAAIGTTQEARDAFNAVLAAALDSDDNPRFTSNMAAEIADRFALLAESGGEMGTFIISPVPGHIESV